MNIAKLVSEQLEGLEWGTLCVRAGEGDFLQLLRQRVALANQLYSMIRFADETWSQKVCAGLLLRDPQPYQ